MLFADGNRTIVSIELRSAAKRSFVDSVEWTRGLDAVRIQLVGNTIRVTKDPSSSPTPIVTRTGSTVVAVTTDAIYLVVKVRRSSRFGAWLDVYVTILNPFPPLKGILFSS